jgi:chemotaxis protein methyltransferase CheR
MEEGPGGMEFVELKLADAEFQQLRNFVYQSTGISLAESKRALIVSRLFRRLMQLNFRSFTSYVHLLKSDPREVDFMINRITTNHTKFYREPHQFEVLKRRILPTVWENKKKRKENTIRIWSAGCSSGEEVYTILFEVFEALNIPFQSKYNRFSIPFHLEILGSDIDTGALNKAVSGQYSDIEIKEVKKSIVSKYFDRVSPNEYQVKEILKKYVIFKRINLVNDTFRFQQKVDIIFCRNVVIYFNEETRQKVYNKFHGVMDSPGFFFSGHSENLFKYHHIFKFIEKSIYKKVES